MIEIAIPLLTLLAALGSGLMAGTFFAFSVFVMGALARLPADQGIAAMQSINVVVINPLFLGVFLGTGVVSALLAIIALFTWSSAGAAWSLAGSVLYLLGCLFVTIAFNVPLNDELARLRATAPNAAAAWPSYQQRWTAWNHVRAIAPTLALVCFLLAMRGVHG